MLQSWLADWFPKHLLLSPLPQMKGKFCEAVSAGGQQGHPERAASMRPAVICALVKEETSLQLSTPPSTEFTPRTVLEGTRVSQEASEESRTGLLS